MTPFLQRSIQLLQLSSLEFQQEVQDVLSSNPFLEAIEPNAHEPKADTHPDQEDAPDQATPSSEETPELLWNEGPNHPASSRLHDEEWDPTLGMAQQLSLREHLLAQAGCLRLSPRDHTLVATVIDALETSGYLLQPIAELGPLSGLEPSPEPDELAIALRHVQALEPVGIGARSVSECLRLQLLAEHDRHDSTVALALCIADEHLTVLAAHDFQRLQRLTGCTPTELQAAVLLLRSLEPRPGARFATEQPEFVVADVRVHREQGRWVATINPDVVPRIHVSTLYAKLLKGRREHDQGLTSQHLREARWLVRNIEQRFLTIQRVAQAIVDHQSRFFEYGPIAMKPLTLGEIANQVSLHESTVSRVTTRKYMTTARGLFEFKHFFCSQVDTAAGGACSSTAVRALITELIANEDSAHPLSDIKLTRLLAQRGIKVARRTVSKYRDGLHIPAVDVRRMAHRANT